MKIRKSLIMGIFLVLTWLSGVTGVRTEELYLRGSPQHECWIDGGPSYPARSNGTCYRADAPNPDNSITLISTTCEQRMEAAMRAMEPFLWQNRAMLDDTGERFLYRPLSSKELNAHSHAWEQWDAAKACWKEGP